MGRRRAGVVEYVRTKGNVPGHYRVRVSLNDGSRSPWIPLAPTSDCLAHREWAESKALEYSERAMRENLTPADFGIIKGSEAPAVTMTCEDYFTKWVAARKESGLRTASTDKCRWTKWLAPHLSTKLITSVTTRDLEQIVASLDRDVRAGKLAWKTSIHVWGLVTKMFDDARRSKDLSLRARTDNPTDSVRGPDRGASKVRSYLFPNELITLLSCERVPMRRRLLVAFSVYTGLRAGEMRALQWGDVHEEEGYILVHQAVDRETGESKTTKTGKARKVPIEAELLPLLAALRERGGKGNVFRELPHRSQIAMFLRADLKEAKVDRDGLLEDTETTAQIDWHDLRHTYGTWRAVRGDDLTKISRAMGHSTTAMTEKYINEAESFEGQRFGVPFGPLPGCFSDIFPTAKSFFVQKRGDSCAGRPGIEPD